MMKTYRLVIYQNGYTKIDIYEPVKGRMWNEPRRASEGETYVKAIMNLKEADLRPILEYNYQFDRSETIGNTKIEYWRVRTE